MKQAYIALGSNIGDKAAHLRAAIARLRALPSVHDVKVSSIYETVPVGYLEQDLFYNMVVAIQTTDEAEVLLGRLQEIEQLEGRERLFKNGPRTLDLDILLYGGERIDLEGLTVPHPRMQERAFVLAPLLELAATCVIPGLGQSVEQLYQQLPETERNGVRRLGDLLEAEEQ
ncbi:2-amino-4-hydroxy-6-hydroxymethyldihydropteridine diphosphokinase [Exiguobacterium sp. BRG2]|uniref:2-amino-4-hydroxy-6- hydroxymethyldihydropteridine diphosphokinase n=1 Tax=Exiguobacterium sp. BRG2 TaxID=2962584 RepID=UPI0028826FBB|nr:2-amino-4-hydroxy-6-hydroxymethyldihydropteridine diphosphokinase [Exiguobacterium sp. BRG2]MDT0174347.1 2-amino-4-hydroxy-6-hydroxymethyldihydropteridine diphosphokinase [Exiguobacterium sp. BRG2]